MASTDTAVTVVEQSAIDQVVEWNLDEFPVDRFNRLLPTQTLSIPTDLLRPVVQIVALNPDEKAGDVYHSNDMPDGHAAPTKVALRKFATAAGISIVDERRTDDGSNPDVIEVTCWAEMLLPTGQRLRATGQKRIDLNALTWKSPQHRGKFKSFFLEHVSSRAQNRAIRALLSLRGSYPLATYSKPFAVVSFAPNMNHPEVRARMLDAMAPAVAQLYGPPAVKQLAPGAPIDVTPAAEDDPAPATPTALPGERLAKAESDGPAEPDWMRAADPSPAAASAEPTFADRIREAAADPEAPKGVATKPQKEQLSTIFAAAGGRVFTAGFAALWPDANVNAISAAQARAIVLAAESDEAFAEHWAELAGAGSAAA